MIDRIRLLREDRLLKDEDKGGREMEEKLNFTNFQDLQEQLKVCSGYMLGITFLKDGVLTHHFLTNNFPNNDVKMSLNEIKKLALSPAKLRIVESKDEPKK